MDVETRKVKFEYLIVMALKIPELPYVQLRLEIKTTEKYSIESNNIVICNQTSKFETIFSVKWLTQTKLAFNFFICTWYENAKHLTFIYLFKFPHFHVDADIPSNSSDSGSANKLRIWLKLNLNKILKPLWYS